MANEHPTATAHHHLKSRGHSLMTRILLILVAGSIVLCSTIAITVGSINSRLLTTYAKNLVTGNYHQLQGVVAKDRETLKNETLRLVNVQTVTSIINRGNAGEIRTYLDNIKLEAGVDSIYILDNRARFRYSSSDAVAWETGDFENSEFFQNAGANVTTAMLLLGKNVSMSAIRSIGLDGQGNRMYVLFTKGVSTDDQADYYSLVTGCDFTLFLEDIRIATSLADDNGVRQIGTAIDNPEAVDAVYNREEYFVNHNVLAGHDYMTIYAPFNLENTSTNSMVALGMRIDDVYTMMRDLVLYSTITIIISCAVFAIVILVFFSNVIIQPLRAAAWAIHELADVSKDTDLTYRVPVRGNNEISRMSADINTFLGHQQDLIIDLQSAQGVLKEIGSNLKSVAQDSATATSQITANINSVKTHADNQVKSLKNTAQEMEHAHELEVAFDGKIENQTASIVESSSSIEEMVQNIASVSASVHKMNESFQELSDVTKNGEQRQAQVDIQVTAMSEQSKLLVEANSVISRIASQTNLLAMNAAIEAAHAGEAGAGFSVVADEIRSLAETSAKQTRMINQQLKEIANTINEVVSASQLSKQAFGTIIERLSQTGSIVQEIGRAMEEQNNASKQVLQALRNMNTDSEEVQTMSKNLRRSNERVMAEMEQLGKIVETVTGSMDEMSHGAQQIGNSAGSVSDMAIETDNNINVMADLVKKFKV